MWTFVCVYKKPANPSTIVCDFQWSINNKRTEKYELYSCHIYKEYNCVKYPKLAIFLFVTTGNALGPIEIGWW